jgi:hypothetical protein
MSERRRVRAISIQLLSLALLVCPPALAQTVDPAPATGDSNPPPDAPPTLIAAATAWGASYVQTSDGKMAAILLVYPDENDLLANLLVSYDHHTVRIPGADLEAIAPRTLGTRLTGEELLALPQ